jgi:alginate O-acetyltransferase complex protein AlgI
MTYKILLIISGFATLLLFGGEFESIFMLFFLATLSFHYSKWVNGFASLETRDNIFRWAVPLCFVVIVTFNISGFIGTLAGSNGGAENFVLFLGAPFYFLSIAACLADIASRKRPCPTYVDFLVYVVLPFKLLAGPLERPSLLNRISDLKWRFRQTQLLISWPWVTLGAFMKFVIANRLNPASNLNEIDPISVLLTASIFELKFYFDFAGYSFMAYGLALACGIKITLNFIHPFFAANVVLFWRRWHISLGRFLSRYILDRNIRFIKHRKLRELFVASIFLVSAMWHGGTVNYLIWGLFHSLCYYFYVKSFWRYSVPKPISILSMISFLVIGRFLATDSQSDRLLAKIINLLNPLSYLQYLHNPHLAYSMDSSEFNAILLAFLFLCMEYYSIKRYGLMRPYHFFRKPIVSLSMLIFLLCTSRGSMSLLYARI